MHALIDFDWASYAFGNATDDEYKPLAWPFVKSRIDGTINKIVEATGADTFQLYLTSADKSNFRFETATIVPYKGTRPTEKPFYYDRIRDYLVKRGAIVIYDREADDQVCIEQRIDMAGATEDEYGTVICHVDKDIDICPGWHYNWMKPDDGVYWITEIEGLRKFYKQCLTGDSVDNILGLFGVGKKSKLVSALDDMDTEEEMFDHVLEQYTKRLGSYAGQFLLENGRLLWMQRSADDIWELPK
tara:strand:- start:5440 stop:6171 length:732 start_codon:yes stop_codon:yes gene_type:complete